MPRSGRAGMAGASDTMGRPEPAFRPFAMDRPPLHVFVRELAEHERLQALVAALPTRARVSEPVLPLLLATLHEQLDRGLVCLLPEDADARDASEAAGWFIGADRVALLPGRGVGWSSGLEPPPHLVGERARALDVLARGGLVCASAIAVAEGMPPAQHRPAPIRLEVGEEPGVEGPREALALAGYERVERAEERGQFAVRGGIVDVFPTTGREPLRVEFFGDEIEQVRAFSPFTQRALHPVTDAIVYPAAERRAELVDPSTSLLLAEEGAAPVVPADLVLALDRVPDFVWQPEEVRRVWAEEGLHPVGLKGATELDPFPQSQPFAFEAQRPALAARGLAEAEQELAGFVRAGNRVVVAFPHAGEALRTQNLLRRADAHMFEPGADLPEDPSSFSRSPRRAAASSGASSGSSSFPTPRSSASGRRAPIAASVARSPRSPTCAPATSSSTRITGSGSCSASRRRRSQGSRATTSSSASAARTGSTSRTSSSARSRSTSAPTPARPPSPSSAARRGRT